jgi:hypothetical protein
MASFHIENSEEQTHTHTTFSQTINKLSKIAGYIHALVAHVCNTSYSGGRDQEDHGSKPAWANNP